MKPAELFLKINLYLINFFFAIKMEKLIGQDFLLQTL